MTRRASALSAWIVAATLGLAAACGGEGVPAVAAQVEGTPITSAQIDELYDVFAATADGESSLAGAGPGSLRVDPRQVRAAVLSYRIKVAFLEALAAREGVRIPDAAVDRSVYDTLAEGRSLQVAGYRGQDLEVAARIEAISKAIAAKLLPEVTVTDPELRSAYKDRQDVVGESFRATTDIAFMTTPEAASQLQADLNAGKRFADATRELAAQTLDAQTVDITPISPLSAELISTVRTLDPGETAEPVKFDLGGPAVFVVLHQQKRVDLPALSLKQAAPDLSRIVTDHKRFLFFQEWLKQQFLSAKITVDDYYGAWNPSFQAVV